MTMKPMNGGAVATDPDRHPGLGWMPGSVVDPKGGRSGARKVLVVSTIENISSSIAQHIRTDDVVKVVVPAVGQGLLDWLANDEKAFSHAQDVAKTTAEQLPGEPVVAGAGEADVRLAIRDALATFPADEIVVAVESHGWTVADSLELDDAAGSSDRTIAGVPVRIVTIASA